MAAAGIVALHDALPRLKVDHENARYLADEVAALDERLLELDAPLTNIVRVNFGAAGLDTAALTAALWKRNIRIKRIDERICRMATHGDIGREQICVVVAELKSLLR